MNKIVTYIILCSLVLIAAPVSATSFYDTLSPQQKSAIQKELSFYESLKKCTPASLAGDKISMRINGISSGNCDWTFNYGNSGLLSYKCYAPTAITAQFASLKIDYLKEMYGMTQGTSMNAFEKITKSDYIEKYCH